MLKLPNIFEKQARIRKFRAGETIFVSGEPADCMYIVNVGRVDIVKGHEVIETVGPEGFFGELALVDSGKRSAMARAQTDCELAAINDKQFQFMVAETPFFSLVVMREMAARLRRA
jgi:CRP/FNR family transcriptional regulator, cyclic AMP receptor protein